MDPIPGSALGRHSLVDSEGYIVGTSIHALTALRRREAASTSGNTCNPASFSILGKRKDDADDVDDGGINVSFIEATKVQHQREDRAAKRPGWQAPDQYRPSAYGFDPHSPPFDWFTQTGNRPLDIDADIVWMLEQGRYHGYRLSTAELEPLAVPQLVMPETVERAIARAKKELAHQKRQFTGNPKARWNTQLPSAPIQRPLELLPETTAATAQYPMNYLTSVSIAQLPRPSLISSSAAGSGLRPDVNQGLPIPPAQLPTMIDNAPNDSGRFVNRVHDIAPIAVKPSNESSHGNTPAIAISTPGGNIRSRQIHHNQAYANSTPSVENQVIAPDAMKPYIVPSKQSMATALAAGPKQPQPGLSKVTIITSQLQHQETRLLDQHKTNPVNQHNRANSATNNTGTLIGGRKRGPTTESADGSRPKRVRLSMEAPVNFPKPSNDLKHKQSYTREDHMIDYLTPWQKRKPAGAKAQGNARRKGSVSQLPMPSTVRMGGPARYNTKKASMSSLVVPPVNHMRIYTAEARERAKNDPILKIQIDQADRQARELSRVPEEPDSDVSFVRDGMHQYKHKLIKKPAPMSETLKRPPLQELPAAVPAYVKFVHMIQQQNADENSAHQDMQITQRSESKMPKKMQQKLPRSSSGRPTFAPPSTPVITMQQSTVPYSTTPTDVQTSNYLTVNDTDPNSPGFSTANNIDASFSIPASSYQWAPSDADHHVIIGADYVADQTFYGGRCH
ncbi:MAG: hypothetical protein Q9213_002484 [Squamulea squamosa]